MSYNKKNEFYNIFNIDRIRDIYNKSIEYEKTRRKSNVATNFGEIEKLLKRYRDNKQNITTKISTPSTEITTNPSSVSAYGDNSNIVLDDKQSNWIKTMISIFSKYTPDKNIYMYIYDNDAIYHVLSEDKIKNERPSYTLILSRDRYISYLHKILNDKYYTNGKLINALSSEAKRLIKLNKNKNG